MLTLPNQRIDRNSKKNKTFYKPTYDYIINAALSNNNKDNIKLWLDAANGKVNNTSLSYLISPLLKTNDTDNFTLPGELRNTDLILTVRDRNIGEYIGLPYKAEVIVYDADAVGRRDRYIANELNKVVQQAIINELNNLYNDYIQQASQSGEAPINTNLPTIEIPNIEQFIKVTIDNWLDEKAIQGQNRLNLLNEINDFNNKRLQMFFYWWACEEFYTYRRIINNEVYTEVISPLDGYAIQGTSDFIEDSEAFVIRRLVPFTEIKNQYWERLDPSEREYLEKIVLDSNDGYYKVSNQFLSTRFMGSAINPYTNSTDTSTITANGRLIVENIVIWRTEVPIKIYTYTNAFGNEVREIIDDENISEEIRKDVKEEWIEEVWIGTRFGDEEKGIYLSPEPCAVQRYDRHLFRPKLPVGGKKGILRNIDQKPIPARLIPYELLIEALTLHIERTIAKYQPYINVLPQSIFNNDAAGTPKEKMFYLKADNTLLYDDSTIDLQTVVQGLRTVNMAPVADYIRYLVDIKDHYKKEGLEIASMNSYRLGDIMPSTGKGVMQESIYRAALGNVLSITMFNAALERDHNADIEFSKVAYIGGKQGAYYDPDSRKNVLINIEATEGLEIDYGVKSTNSKIEAVKLEEYKQLVGFPAAQNGDFEVAAATIDADSLAEVRRVVRDIVKRKQEMEAILAKQQNESNEQVAMMNQATQQQKSQTEIAIANMKAQTDITVALINKEGNTEVPNTDNVLNTISSIGQDAFKLRELESKERMQDKELAFKDRQLASNEKIARENKNKYDSNKK